MTFDEAMRAVIYGHRVSSDAIPQGWVVKSIDDSLMVVHEGTGSSFELVATPERLAAEWHLVEGWASYAT